MAFQDGGPVSSPFRRASETIRRTVAGVAPAQRVATLVQAHDFDVLPRAAALGLITEADMAPYGAEIAAAQSRAADARHRETLTGALVVGSVLTAGALSAAAGGSAAASTSAAELAVAGVPETVLGGGVVMSSEGLAAAELAAVEGAGALAAEELVLMPAAIPDAAALGPSFVDQVGAWLTKNTAGILGNVAKSVVTSTLVGAVRRTPKPAAAAARPGGRMGEEELFGISSNGGFPTMADWLRVGETALQVYANRNNISPSATGAAPVQAAFPALGPLLGGAARAAAPVAGMAASLIGGAARAAVGILRSAGGRILGWVLPSGQRVSRKAAVALAKNVGLSAAAGAVGASLEEMAEAVMQEEGRKHRRRGISGRDLAVTTRTMGRVERMHRKIAKAARAHAR